MVCGKNLYPNGNGELNRCLDFNSGEEFIKTPKFVPTPEKVINIYAKKFSVIITKSYDCLIWGDFNDLYLERFLNPFENVSKINDLDSDDEDQAEYDRKSVMHSVFINL